MEIEMIHYALLHMFNQYKDVRKMYDKLKEEKEKVSGRADRIEEELTKLRGYRTSYELTLCD